jgi:orotidine-5'-phosphate decarboxylase
MLGSATCLEALSSLQSEGKHVCVGLDTDPSRLPHSVLPEESPARRVVAFNAAIIEATAGIACAYKPNAAFYESLGRDGFEALRRTIQEVRRAAPGVPVILDAKRGDIGSTNLGYVNAAFDVLGADAITVHPYLGRESLSPFLNRAEALIFVLVRTSNPGASEFQDLISNDLPVYRHIARAVARDWNRLGNCGLVVGATYPQELVLIREDVPADLPFLIPGVGAQGGDLRAVVEAEVTAGTTSFVINASRSILYASAEANFAEAAAEQAGQLHNDILRLMSHLGTG